MATIKNKAAHSPKKAKLTVEELREESFYMFGFIEKGQKRVSSTWSSNDVAAMNEPFYRDEDNSDNNLYLIAHAIPFLTGRVELEIWVGNRDFYVNFDEYRQNLAKAEKMATFVMRDVLSSKDNMHSLTCIVVDPDEVEHEFRIFIQVKNQLHFETKKFDLFAERDKFNKK